MVVLDSVGGVVLCEGSVSGSAVVSFNVEIGVVDPEMIRVISCVTTSCGANEVGPEPSFENKRNALISNLLLSQKTILLLLRNSQHS